MIHKAYLKSICLLLGTFLLLFLAARSFVNNHPAFDFSPREGVEYSWESYLKDRDRRNIKKMNRSYAELMSLARAYLRDEDYQKAANTFFEAKTLFPERIDPRKNLCYTYIMQCRNKRGLPCQLAKKEIYYALKHVDHTDVQNKTYLSELASLVNIEDIIDKSEEEALSEIF